MSRHQVCGRRGRSGPFGVRSHPRHGQPPRLAASAQGRELRSFAARRYLWDQRPALGIWPHRNPRDRFSASRAAGEAAKSPSTASPPPSIRRQTRGALGLALVTEDRKALGLHLASTVRDNIALPSVEVMSRFGVRGFAREIRACGRHGPPACRALLGGRSNRCDAVGRQSAKGRHRAKWLAAAPRGSAVSPRRADARHRRGRETGDLSTHFRLESG